MHRSKLRSARLALLVAISGVLLTQFGVAGRNDAARRVRVGGTRGVGVIHQVRVEPYGRAAVEHAYLDDDEDESYVEPLARGGPDTPPRPQSPAFLPAAVEMDFSAAQSLAFLPPADQSVHSTDRLGIPAGRAPPLS